MARKNTPNKRKHVTHTDTHIMLKKGLAVYAALVFLFFILTSLSTLVVVETYNSIQNRNRLSEIHNIYSSLNLDQSYREADYKVFGDKRKYDYDDSRTQASSISYGRNADREATFSDLRNRIIKAGFQKIDGPNYGQAARQDHYRNDKGQYIRVSIATKALQDAIFYGTNMPHPNSPEMVERGPVYVTIKVNLDDNNE